jgi:hypothetical protein
MTDSLRFHSKLLEHKLADVDAPLLEIALAAARQILEEDPESQANQHALMGALAMAEAFLEQLKASTNPFALDGDIHFGHQSFAPGLKLAGLLNELRAAEREAVKQRTAIIMPIAKAVIAMADTGEAAQ